MASKLRINTTPYKPIPVRVSGVTTARLSPTVGQAATAAFKARGQTYTPPARKAVKTVDPLTRITNRYIASLLTPAQQRAQAASSVDSQIKLALAGMRASTLAAQQQASHQADRAQQYAMALGSLRDMSGLQTNADYRNAAHDIQGLGTGLTGTIAESQQAAANDAASRIAAATEGLGQAKGLDVEGLKNIAQYTGVAMPATNLYEEAANRAAQARLDQDVRAQKVGNIALDYLQKGTEAQQELQRQRTALEATRPSLYQTAISNLQGGGRQDLATIISALALANTQTKTAAEIVAGKAKTKQGAQTTTANVAKAGAQAGATTGKVYGTDGKGNLAAGFFWGSPGRKNATPIPKGWMLDPADPTHHAIIKNPFAYSPTSATGTPTAKQTQALITTWSKTIDDSILADNSPYVKDISDPYAVQKGYAKSVYRPTMSYAEAKRQIVAKLPPALRTNAQMLANIDDSLRKGGYKPTTTVTKKKTTVTTKSPSAGGGKTKLGPTAPGKKKVGGGK